MKNYAKRGKTTKTTQKKVVKEPKEEIKETPADDITKKEPRKRVETKAEKVEDVEIMEEIKGNNDIPTKNDIIDPLIENEPIIKEYSKLRVKGNVNSLPDIPQDTIERPTIDITGDSPISSTSNDGISDVQDAENIIKDIPDIEEKKEPRQQGNIDLEDKPKKEQTQASKHLADTIIDGYDMAHGISLSFLSKTEEKLMKQAVKGKIDADVINSEIQVGSKVYQIQQLVYDYNNNLENVLVVSDEFKDEIRPLLKEELQKRGMGLTPMQRIATLMIKDLQPKIVQIVQLNSTMNSILKQQSEILKQNKEEILEQEKKGNAIIIEDHTTQEPEEVEQD